MTGTLLNVATVLVGTLIGTLVGDRLPERLRRRVLDGLALVTLVIGIDLALAWDDTSPLYVLATLFFDLTHFSRMRFLPGLELRKLQKTHELRLSRRWL